MQLVPKYLWIRDKSLISSRDGTAGIVLTLGVSPSVCVYVSSWQNVILETPTAAGTTAKTGLSTLDGCYIFVCGQILSTWQQLCKME